MGNTRLGLPKKVLYIARKSKNHVALPTIHNPLPTVVLLELALLIEAVRLSIFFGSSLLCVGNTKIELSGYKVNNGYKVSIRAVSPGLRLGRLYETVNAFQYAIGQS